MSLTRWQMRIIDKTRGMSKLLKCVRDIIVVAAIGVVAFLLAGVIVEAVNVANADVRFLVSYITPMLLMLSGVVLYSRVLIKPDERTLWSPRGLSPTVHIWGLLLLVALAVVLSPLMRLLPAHQTDIPSGVWAVVTLVVVAPIVEELIFRGGVFTIMRGTCRPTMAAMISALLFGIMHGQVAIAIEAFLAGVVFSYSYILTQSIFAPIVLHIFNNVIAYVLLQFTYQDCTISDFIGALPSFDIIYGISLLILILGIVHITITYRRADKLIKEGKTLRDIAPKKSEKMSTT